MMWLTLQLGDLQACAMCGISWQPRGLCLNERWPIHYNAMISLGLRHEGVATMAPCFVQ